MAEDKREKFRISVPEHPEFPKQFDGMFMKSSDLCKMISDIFREVYSDWEGCTFEVVGGVPTISFFFNQRQMEIPNKVPATSMFTVESKSGSAALDRRRFMDQRVTRGDRFVLTEEGEEGLEPFLMQQYINRKTGKPNWKNLVLQASPNQNTQGTNALNMAMTQVQYTKVLGLDPNKILSEYYGRTDESGNPIVFGVTITRSLNMYPQAMNMPSAGWLLRIDRLDHKRLEQTAREDLGYMATDNLGIVR